MKKTINYGRQYIDDDDIKAVSEVLRSDYLTTGPKVELFELELNKFTGAEHIVCVNSGSAALHGACFVAGIGPGDEVIVPSMTFVATANAVLHCGATPVICDVNPDTLLIDINSVKKLITEKTKAIIAVDYAGQVADYKALRELGFIVIADACHSFGIQNYDADFVCYSFHPVKGITTGEGGAIQCRNLNDSLDLQAFRDNGRYGIRSCFHGFNYRMSDIQAALGISQLKKYEWMRERRLKIANKYMECNLKHLSVVSEHAYHLFVVKVYDRFDFLVKMQELNIECGVHYLPLYMHDHLKYKPLVNTELIKDDIVSLPIYPGLTHEDQNYVIECMYEVLFNGS